MGWKNFRDKITGKKYWKRHVEKKLNEFEGISNKWGFNPPLNREFFKPDAEKWADVKYGNSIYVASKEGGFSAALKILNYVFMVALITLSALTFGSSTGLAFGVYSALLVGIERKNAQRVQVLAQNLGDEFKKAGIKWKMQNKRLQSDVLSSNIIFSKYDIYATNRIYTQGRAGDLNSFNPVRAYDANKGILGQNVKDELDKVADFTQGRAHTELAGNEGFAQSMIGANFGLEKARLDYEMFKNNAQNVLNDRLYKLNEGFAELLDAGFGIVIDVNKTYNDMFARLINPLKTQMSSAQFLKEMQSYSLGAKHTFDFLFFKDKGEQKKSAMEGFLSVMLDWDSEQSKRERAKWSDERLLEAVVEQQIVQMSVFFDDVYAGGEYEYYDLRYSNPPLKTRKEQIELDSIKTRFEALQDDALGNLKAFREIFLAFARELSAPLRGNKLVVKQIKVQYWATLYTCTTYALLKDDVENVLAVLDKSKRDLWESRLDKFL